MAERGRPLRPGEPARNLGAPSVVLDAVVGAVFHVVVVFAVYLHFAGHNQPGGGFIAGLAIGAAYVLRWITGRKNLLRSRWPVVPEVLLGVGSVLVVGTALTSLALGEPLLSHHTWEYEVVVLGTVKWTSALVFDTGILLAVTGVIMALVVVFGSEEVGR